MPRTPRTRAPHTPKSSPTSMSTTKRTTRTSAKAAREVTPHTHTQVNIDLEASPSATLVDLEEIEKEKVGTRRSARLKTPSWKRVDLPSPPVPTTPQTPKVTSKRSRNGKKTPTKSQAAQTTEQTRQDDMDVDAPSASLSLPFTLPAAEPAAEPKLASPPSSGGSRKVTLRLSPKPVAQTSEPVQDTLEPRPEPEPENETEPTATNTTPRAKRIKLIVRSPTSTVPPALEVSPTHPSSGKNSPPPFTTLHDKQWPPAPSHPTPPPRPAHPHGQGPQPHNNNISIASPFSTSGVSDQLDRRDSARSQPTTPYASSSGSSASDLETPLPTPEHQPVLLPGDFVGKGKGKGKSWNYADHVGTGRNADVEVEGERMEMDNIEGLIGDQIEQRREEKTADEVVEQLCALCKGWKEYLRTYGDALGKNTVNHPNTDETKSTAPSPDTRKLVLAMSEECESCRQRQSRVNYSMDVDSTDASPLTSPSAFLPAVPPSTPITPLPFFSVPGNFPGTATSFSPVISSPTLSAQSCDCQFDDDCCGGLQYLPLEVWDPYGELDGKPCADADTHVEAKLARGEWGYELVTDGEHREDDMTGLGLRVGEEDSSAQSTFGWKEGVEVAMAA